MTDWYKFPPEELDEVPTSEGVYLLSETDSDEGIVYAGLADGEGGLRQRLSQHPDPNNPCLQGKSIKYFAFEETSNSEEREQELKNEHDPECNRA